jgi:type IV secretory pathway TraG/TraD family ATPase VirD4
MENDSYTSVRSHTVQGLDDLLGGGGGRLPTRVLLSLLMLATMVGVALASVQLRLLTTDSQRKTFVSALKARTKIDSRAVVSVPCSPGDERKIGAKNNDGQETLTMPVIEAIRYTQADFTSVSQQLRYALYTCIFSASITVALIFCMIKRRCNQQAVDHIRGGRISTAEKLTQELHRSGRAGSYSFAGVPLLVGREYQHLLVLGTTGAGKTVAIRNLLEQIRAKKERALVFDPEGEFCAQFWQAGDVVLNPFDQRMPPWTIWDEVHADYHLTALAEALIPQNGNEPFFDLAAQDLFEDLVRRTASVGGSTNKKFLEIATNSDLPTLYKFLEGLPAARHVSPQGERKSDSVLSNFVQKVRVWRYLPDSSAGQGFSIRRFVQQQDNDAGNWLFVTANEEQLPAIKRLLSLWTAIWIEAILSLPSTKKKIWTILDELPALNRLRIVDLMARGRKHGACCLIGFQDAAQLDAVYGKHVAHTIRSCANTWLALRQGDHHTAQIASEAFGSAEVAEIHESVNRGWGRAAADVSQTKRRVVRPLVLDSEFMHLPDLHGYLRQPSLPVVPVTLSLPGRSKSNSSNSNSSNSSSSSRCR